MSDYLNFYEKLYVSRYDNQTKQEIREEIDEVPAQKKTESGLFLSVFNDFSVSVVKTFKLLDCLPFSNTFCGDVLYTASLHTILENIENVEGNFSERITDTACWAVRGILRPLTLGYVRSQSEVHRKKYEAGDFSRVDALSPLPDVGQCPQGRSLYISRYYSATTFTRQGSDFFNCV